jgi:hypothetical protein
MKFMGSTNAKHSKYVMHKSNQTVKVRHCILLVLACLILCKHLL